MAKRFVISKFYKTLLYHFIFVPVICLLYACPFSSVYKLDKEALIPVDEVLLGKWSTTVLNKKDQSQIITVTLSKKNETAYDINLTGNFTDLKGYKVSKADSINGSAFMSLINKRPTLNIEIKGQVFIVAVIYKNDTLSLLPLADGFTAKYIKSDADLRTAVETHFSRRLFPKYDEQFSLKKMVRIN